MTLLFSRTSGVYGGYEGKVDMVDMEQSYPETSKVDMVDMAEKLRKTLSVDMVDMDKNSLDSKKWIWWI